MKVEVLLRRLGGGNARCGSADIRLSSNSTSCTTSRLPEAVLPERDDFEWVILDNTDALGKCSDFDISQGTTSIYVKLPPNSPVEVKAVKVFYSFNNETTF